MRNNQTEEEEEGVENLKVLAGLLKMEGGREDAVRRELGKGRLGRGESFQVLVQDTLEYARNNNVKKGGILKVEVLEEVLEAVKRVRKVQEEWE